jgi:hypothetical protein
MASFFKQFSPKLKAIIQGISGILLLIWGDWTRVIGQQKLRLGFKVANNLLCLIIHRETKILFKKLFKATADHPHNSLNSLDTGTAFLLSKFLYSTFYDYCKHQYKDVPKMSPSKGPIGLLI